MMEGIAIRVSDVHKRYRLGVFGGTTLAEDIKAWWAKVNGRPDPRVPIGKEYMAQRAGEFFLALRGLSFDVHQGEIVGVIGRNGAGKSTLLKLMSRITSPTSGTIRIKGRTSSLLEVGTGFNPELTGRENIFLNGAILGMRKHEIEAKLDEIIAFSGIEHHIDSPVKRYSSGMRVRLGFAVAAHLEPEVLIIDEVLAVGDAEFQRKCLGKMKDVASSGRTILFVSHNMTSVRSLCNRVIWLQDGKVAMDGPSEEVVTAYLRTYASLNDTVEWGAEAAPGNERVRLRSVSVEHDQNKGLLTWRSPISIRIGFDNMDIADGTLNVGILLFNGDDVLLFSSSLMERTRARTQVGWNCVRCIIPAEFLNVGDYRVTVMFYHNAKRLLRVDETVAFAVHDTEREGAWHGRRKGVVIPALTWELVEQ